MSEAPVEPIREHDRRRLLRGAATLAGLGLGGSLVLVARPALAAQAVSTLTLINAATDQPVAGFDPLSSGATLDLSTLPMPVEP